MPEQRIISVDSTILNGIQKCSEFANLSFNEHLQYQEKGEALERGDLLHKMLEMYYGLEAGIARRESDTWIQLRDIGIQPIQNLAREEIIRIINDAGPFFGARMSLEPAEIEETIYQVNEYLKFYSNENWKTLAVEEVGSKLLYEDDEIKIIYNAKIDRIAEQGSLILPWDHKSSKRRQDPSSLSNQFMGYCWILNSQHMLVNKIGFQKTLKPAERFTRDILTYDRDRLEEWRVNSIYWIKLWDFQNQLKQFPRNFTSCDKYSGCMFRSLCESSPEGREWKKERDFIVGQRWDVAAVLESNEDK